MTSTATAAGSGVRRRRTKKARDFTKLVSGVTETEGVNKTWAEVRPGWGTKEEQDEIDKQKAEDEEAEANREKANFGLTGALAEDAETGNTFNGVVLKWSEPPEARKPMKKWRLYVFKADEQIDTLYLHRQSAYLVGRERRVADVPVHHPSISSQHAVIQYRMVEEPNARGGKPTRVVKPYVMDLESTNGTKINGKKIDPACYTELREKDCIKFGNSSRDYILLHDKST